MPQIQAPTPLFAINAANDTSETGVTDRTLGNTDPYGDLLTGVWFDLTESQANLNSDTLTGLLHYGRYRRVQVSSGATAANVATGTLAYWAPGGTVQGVTILTAGSGQTAGTYAIAAAGGGGTGAIVSVVVGSAGTVISATVTQPGSGYTSLPTVTVAAGGTPGTVQLQMLVSSNVVTSQDAAFGLASGVSPFPAGMFLNAITPGNWGFIQELGLAPALAGGTLTGTPAIGNLVTQKTGNAGSVDVLTVATALTEYTVGYAVDVPTASKLFRVKLTLPVNPA